MSEAPSQIGRYEIRREIGRGMMGVVYEAVDPALHRRVALKTIEVAHAVTPQEREAFERRFLTEARVAARLTHPNIVIVHDVGRDAATGTPFMALEYLEGRTLAELVAEGGPLGWREALRMTSRLADALYTAHREGVIHRDVKPANIMVLPSGEPKVMDFGIAKVPASELTVAGQVFGTPSFMSPEQALAQPVDARSDLFSLGTVLYLLLTGRRAFAGESVPQILGLVVRHDPAPPSLAARSIPPEVDYIVARCLAKERDDRYPDGRVLAEDIDDVLAGRPPRHRRTWTPPARVEGTVVSPVARPKERPPAQVPPKPPAPLKPALTVAAQSRRSSTPRSVAVGLAAGLVVLLLLWARGTFAPPPPVVEATPIPTAEATATPVPAIEPSAAPPEASAVPEPTPEPEPVPTPTPKRRLPPPPPATAAAAHEPVVPPTAAMAQLTIDFEHPLKTGSLRVWIDDALVVEADLEGRLTKKVAVLKIRTGRLEQVVPVAPGRRDVRVQVAWEDNVKTETLAGTFEAGTSRLLEVRLGRIRKNLSLEWK